MKAMIVSTSAKPTPRMLREATEVSHRLGAQLVPRHGTNGYARTIARLLSDGEAEFAYIVGREKRSENNGLVHEMRRRGDSRRLFVHPRMWTLVKSQGFESTPLAKAICAPGEQPPRHVCDATAGLGGTALRIAEAFGPNCHVTAVEASAPLACLLEYGMQNLAEEQKAWSPAASRVRCVHADAAHYFERPVVGELGAPDVVFLNPCLQIKRVDPFDIFLQQLAELAPISEHCFHGALSTARRRVILRIPNGVDPLVAGYGRASTRAVKGAQSDYHVYDV